MISVLIPTYNSAIYIGEALESVLQQTRKDFEIIVVDDGSTDETRHIVESFSDSVKYFYQENAGIGTARNRCVQLSAREFLAFLDADDVWLPDKLDLQLREFEADDSLEAVFGMVKQVLQTEWKQETAKQTVYEDDEELFKGYAPGTMLIRRQSFLRVGMFPETQTVGEFIDWFLRAKELDVKMKLLPDLTMLRRVHQGNMMIRQRAAVQDYAKILKQSIDRRRLDKSS